MDIYLWLLQGRLWPLKFFFFSFLPRDYWGRHQKEGRKERKGGGRQAEKVNPTSRPHQIQRSHLPSHCTQQQYDVTGWWPHRCPQHHAFLAPAALQPCAAESLVTEREKG